MEEMQGWTIIAPYYNSVNLRLSDEVISNYPLKAIEQ